MEIEKAFMLVVLSLSGWSVISLLLDRRGYASANRWFATIIAAFCIPQLYFYTRLIVPNGVFELALVAQAMLWVKGPLMMVLVSLLIGMPESRPWRHFAPFTLAVAVYWQFPEYALEFSFAGFFHALIYLVFALLRLHRHRARLQIIYQSYKNSAYYWLSFLVVGMAVVLIVDLVLIAMSFHQKTFAVEFSKIVTLAISGYMLAIAFFSVYRPELFFHEHRMDVNTQNGPPNPKSTVAKLALVQVETAERVDKSWRELDESLARPLAQVLDQLMVQERMYLRNDLSLPALAQRLGISAHQASELLNVYLDTNFYDYVNSFRLTHAANLLRDPKCELRMLDLAFESGFNNKNSFYRTFRARHGVTPADYRNRYVGKGMDAFSG